MRLQLITRLPRYFLFAVRLRQAAEEEREHATEAAAEKETGRSPKKKKIKRQEPPTAAAVQALADMEFARDTLGSVTAADNTDASKPSHLTVAVAVDEPSMDKHAFMAAFFQVNRRYHCHCRNALVACCAAQCCSTR